jgi:hypothetical protein
MNDKYNFGKQLTEYLIENQWPWNSLGLTADGSFILIDPAISPASYDEL